MSDPITFLGNYGVGGVLLALCGGVVGVAALVVAGCWLAARIVRPFRARRVLRMPAPTLTRDDIRGGFYPDMTGGRCACCHIAVLRGDADHPCEAPGQPCNCECRGGRCALCGWASPSLDRDPHDGRWYCQGGCPDDDERDEFPVDAMYAEPESTPKRASQLYRDDDGHVWETHPRLPDDVRCTARNPFWWPVGLVTSVYGLTPIEIDTPEDAA